MTAYLILRFILIPKKLFQK